MMTAGASSPPCSSSAAVSVFVDSASPGRNEVDSFSSASVNLPGRFAGPAAMKMPTSQIANTIHLALEPAGRAKIERRSDIGLEDRQVAVELPLGDLHPVVLPLLALDLDVAVEDVLAEGAQHQLRLGGQLDRLAERLGELLDPEPAPLLGGDVVQVLLHRLRQLLGPLHPLPARR